MSDSKERILEELSSLGDESIAKTHAGWRKRGSGGRYLGVPKALRRCIARREVAMPLDGVWDLFCSETMDLRSVGALILLERSVQGHDDERRELLRALIGHRHLVTDWELVDDLSPGLIGRVTKGRYTKEIALLATSSGMWDRRMAIVSTLWSVREGYLELAFRLAGQYLGDREPYIEKAAGWVLRETGKKDPDRLKSFLCKNGPALSRTTLRYAIERFSLSERLLFQSGEWVP